MQGEPGLASQNDGMFCLRQVRPAAVEMPRVRIRMAIMKIVVIGGSGLIGSKLVTKLHEHGPKQLPHLQIPVSIRSPARDLLK